MTRPPEEFPKAPRLVKRLASKPLTAKRAARLIAEFTILATILGGTLAWLLDRKDFHTLGQGLWWAVQTVTTVGYGDIVPTHTEGRVIATIVMAVGIAAMAVITAAVTASLIENARRRLSRDSDAALADQLRAIEKRLASIEASLRAGGDARG